MKLRRLQNNTPIKEGNPMKPIAFLSLFAAIFLVSCSATRHGATVYDDVYYSPGDPVVHVKEVVVTDKQLERDEPVYYSDEETYGDPQYETPYMDTQSYTDADGRIVNNYYFYGDYYDYSYASRIRRFHRPMGHSYYHDYYTNMYWYNHDPFYWGTSIYVGYGFYPYSSWHMGWGWPRRSHWYNPYYMYGMGYPHYYHGWYSSYWTGYRHGYWDGYYGYPYYGGWYKNSYDENSYYYGPRTGFAGNTGGGGITGSGRPGTFGQKYEEAIAAQNQGREADQISRGSRPVTSQEGRTAGTTPASGTRPSLQEPDRTGSREAGTLREGQRTTASPAEGRQVYERPSTDRSDEGSRTVAPNQRSYEYNRESSRQAPAYERPDAQRQQAQPAQRQPQPYSSPRYTKPKTSEEFTSPAYRSPRETTRPAESAAPQRQEASPSQQRAPQPQATPQRQQPSQPRYTPPNRPSDSRQTAPPSRNVTPSRSPSSSPGYTPPRSSSPPPSRSTSPGISSPSRSSSPPPSRSSSPSISSPSRSSGSSTPSRGSSGSSGSSRSSSGRGGR